MCPAPTVRRRSIYLLVLPGRDSFVGVTFLFLFFHFLFFLYPSAWPILWAVATGPWIRVGMWLTPGKDRIYGPLAIDPSMIPQYAPDSEWMGVDLLSSWASRGSPRLYP